MFKKLIQGHKFVLKIVTLIASYVFLITTLKCKSLNNHMRKLRIKPTVKWFEKHL